MENQRTIRLAVIGIGNIGQTHVAHIDALPDMELVAVCDIDRARADSAAQQYGADAYYSYQDLLTSAALDGIVVATPHYEHVQMTIDALNTGRTCAGRKTDCGPCQGCAKDDRRV